MEHAARVAEQAGRTKTLMPSGMGMRTGWLYPRFISKSLPSTLAR